MTICNFFDVLCLALVASPLIVGYDATDVCFTLYEMHSDSFLDSGDYKLLGYYLP